MAAVGTLPLIGPGSAAARPKFHDWRGTALGADASLRLWHPDPSFATQMIAKSLEEVHRLEEIFSLHRPGSEIVRLNAEGTISEPSLDLLKVLTDAHRVSTASEGAFDVTVQPLWELYAAHFRRAPDDEAGPSEAAIRDALSRVDYRKLEIEATHVSFAMPEMAITLNGIAQGYVTDRVADLLRDAGFEHVVINLGEIRTLGGHPEGRPWQVGIKDPAAPWTIGRMEEVLDTAVATSGGYALQFGPSPAHHHIFDPRQGRSANELFDATVIGPRAILADALSTAVLVAGEQGSETLMSKFPEYAATVTRGDGQARRLVT
jgi:thiamine biosynthesis lipoprotein